MTIYSIGITVSLVVKSCSSSPSSSSPVLIGISNITHNITGHSYIIIPVVLHALVTLIFGYPFRACINVIVLYPGTEYN